MNHPERVFILRNTMSTQKHQCPNPGCTKMYKRFKSDGSETVCWQRHMETCPFRLPYVNLLDDSEDESSVYDIDNLLETGGEMVLNGVEEAETLLNQFVTYLQDLKEEVRDVKEQLENSKDVDKSNTIKTEVAKLLLIIDENNQKITNQQYREAMDSLMVLHNL